VMLLVLNVSTIRSKLCEKPQSLRLFNWFLLAITLILAVLAWYSFLSEQKPSMTTITLAVFGFILAIISELFIRIEGKCRGFER